MIRNVNRVDHVAEAGSGLRDTDTLHRIDDAMRPDQVLFDLDPTPHVRRVDVARVALLIRDALADLHLRCCVKTSGARGLHIAVPIARGPDYGTTRTFARTVALALEHALPGLVSHRIGERTERRVVVDWRQNQTGASIAAPYSVRARRGAPVSCPLAWEEVEEGLGATALGMAAVRQRVAAHGDLYSLALSGEQQLPSTQGPVRGGRRGPGGPAEVRPVRTPGPR